MPPGDRRTVTIVANPFSGSKENRVRVQQFERALRDAGMDVLLAWSPIERATLMRDPGWRRECRCIVAAGGDGTIADVINEINGSPSIPLAVLALGNENLFAKSMGFVVPAPVLARAIAAGHVRRMDLGIANGRKFSLMASLGIDAEVVRRVAAWRAGGTGGRLRRVRHSSYVTHALKAARDYRYPTISLDADGQRVSGRHVFIFNQCRYATGLAIAPDATCDDGMLDWIVFQAAGLPALLRYLWLIRRGRHLACADVCAGRAKRIAVSADLPAPMQLDGDAAGDTPALIEAIPGDLQVIDMSRTTEPTP